MPKYILNSLFLVVFLSLAVNVTASPVVGDWDFCTKQNPCSAGQGDCDSDDECKPGLICMKDVGPQYGFDKGVDVCLSATSGSSSSSSTTSSSTSTSSTSGNFGGGVSSSTSTSTSSTSSTSSGTNLVDLFNSSTSSTSSATSSSSGGGYTKDNCPYPPGSMTYCLNCGPCDVGESACWADKECKTGLKCDLNTKSSTYLTCIKP